MLEMFSNSRARQGRSNFIFNIFKILSQYLNYPTEKYFFFVVNGKLIEEKREISDECNIFYSSIARNLNAKLNSSRFMDTDFEKYLSNPFQTYTL